MPILSRINPIPIITIDITIIFYVTNWLFFEWSNFSGANSSLKLRIMYYVSFYPN